VIDVGSADIMTTLLLLKEEVEHHHRSEMKMVFSRATEAHLIAKDIGSCVAMQSLPFRDADEM
jgi:hypothetical protein